jgi:acyl-CoA synthetase (NDP forming)
MKDRKHHVFPKANLKSKRSACFHTLVQCVIRNADVERIIRQVRVDGRLALLEPEAKEICTLFDIPVPAFAVAKGIDDATRYASDLGYPVVLKIVSCDVPHKSEAGGVIVGLQDSESVRNAYNHIIANVKRHKPNVNISGVMVQRMAPLGTELIIGAANDIQFGQTLMFGVGGVLVEFMKDVVFRVAPITRSMAAQMIREIKAYPLLGGYRNIPRADEESIADILVQLSELLMQFPEIAEVDLNPTIVYTKGASVVDARIVLRADKLPASTETEVNYTSSDTVRPFFEPKSVAIVGASRDPGKMGHIITKHMIEGGFQGRIFPVNPKVNEVLGLKAFSSIDNIPDQIDLVVVAVPAPVVADILRECASRNVRSVIVVSGGFREMGKEGLERENSIKAIAQSAGIRLVGPNVQGIDNPYVGMSMWMLVKREGPIGVISQGGSVGGAIEDWAEKEEIGISKFFPLGNAIDVSETDVLQYYGEDPSTRVIAMNLEGVKNGRNFMRIAREVSKKKPMLVLKGGKTQAGQNAAISHTKSMAGSDAIFGAACEQSGVIRVHTMEELYDASKALALLTLPAGPGVLIITSSGGVGILAADAAEERGLRLPQPSNGAVKQLRSILQPQCVLSNPFDLTSEALKPAAYQLVIEKTASDPDIHAFMPIFADPIQGAAEAVINAARTTNKPIVVCYVGGADFEESEKAKMQSAGIPVFPTPERAVAALHALVRRHEIETAAK